MPLFVLYSSTCAGAALAALLLTPLVMRFAHARGLLDQPGVRKVHKLPTPRVGGIAIGTGGVVAGVLALLAADRSSALSMPLSGPLAIIAASMGVFVVGIADDIKSIPSKWKLVVLVAAASFVVASGVCVHELDFGVGMDIPLGSFSWAMTVAWIIAVPVSLNFIDGLDGLAAGIGVLASLCLAVGTGFSGCTSATILALALAGSLLGFLRFNFRPARIFMGDSGSMFIGFLLACTAVLGAQGAGVRRGIILPACALAVPFLDTALTMVRRSVLQRRSLFAAERGHVHHRLLDNGFCHVHTVIGLYIVTAIAALLGLAAGFAPLPLAAAAVVVMLMFVGLFFRFAGSTRVAETIRAIRRNRSISRESARHQAAFDEMQMRFKATTTFAQWWGEICAAAQMLDFTEVALPLVNRDGSPRSRRWSNTSEELLQCQRMRATVPIEDRRLGSQLHMEVEVAATVSLESAGRTLSLFSRLVTEHGLIDLPDALPQSNGASSPAPVRSKHLAQQFGTNSDEDGDASASPLGEGVRVAVVHDFLYIYAGAERVLEQILRVFPEADLFSLFDLLPDGERGFIRNKNVKTSFLQKMPFMRKRHRAYLPLMPLAIEQLDVSNYDVVISSSYLAAKGVLTRPDQLHVCYCHSPARFAWDLQTQYLGRAGMRSGIKSGLARVLLHYIRIWDTRSANGVDVMLTNSAFVSRRVDKVYRRRSTPMYPPVEIEKFSLCLEKEDFYLSASRMVPYKRIDVIVEAFTKMPGKRLIVVGEGPEEVRLKTLAGPNVRFVGYQSFERLKRLMQRARGFVFAAEEDFGIVPVEAQACGTPVIAFGRGGVTESVIDGRTGVFFSEQTPASLIAAVERFETLEWNPAAICENAKRFSSSRFRAEFASVIEEQWSRFEKASATPVADEPRLGLGLGASAAASLLRSAKNCQPEPEASVG